VVDILNTNVDDVCTLNASQTVT